MLIAKFKDFQSKPCQSSLNSKSYNIVVVCIDLSGKEPHRQVSVVRSPGGVMVTTLARNPRDVGSIPALGTILPIFLTRKTLVAVTMTSYALQGC